MNILLKNDTGRRKGNYIRYEYGEDLFGYLYLNIVRSKKHRAWTLGRYLFKNKRDFILSLDLDMYRRESLYYLPMPLAEFLD